MQNKKQIAYESVINTFSGTLLAFIAVYLILRLTDGLGLDPFIVSVITVGTCTTISLLRNFAVRSFFNKQHADAAVVKTTQRLEGVYLLSAWSVGSFQEYVFLMKLNQAQLRTVSKLVDAIYDVGSTGFRIVKHNQSAESSMVHVVSFSALERLMRQSSALGKPVFSYDFYYAVGATLVDQKEFLKQHALVK